MSNAISGPVSFGLIPQEHWYQPDWIDEEKAAAGRAKMVADNVVYGGEISVVRSLGSLTHLLSHPRKRLVSPSQSFFASHTTDTSNSYRNMCRFNSGVSIVSVYAILRPGSRVAVLLQTSSRATLQVVLASRVRAPPTFFSYCLLISMQAGCQFLL